MARDSKLPPGNCGLTAVAAAYWQPGDSYYTWLAMGSLCPAAGDWQHGGSCYTWLAMGPVCSAAAGLTAWWQLLYLASHESSLPGSWGLTAWWQLLYLASHESSLPGSCGIDSSSSYYTWLAKSPACPAAAGWGCVRILPRRENQPAETKIQIMKGALQHSRDGRAPCEKCNFFYNSQNRVGKF